jgi:hypothetical protein
MLHFIADVETAANGFSTDRLSEVYLNDSCSGFWFFLEMPLDLLNLRQSFFAVNLPKFRLLTLQHVFLLQLVVNLLLFVLDPVLCNPCLFFSLLPCARCLLLDCGSFRLGLLEALGREVHDALLVLSQETLSAETYFPLLLLVVDKDCAAW